MSSRSRNESEPKLTNSGTTSMPSAEAVSGSRSAVESVTSATATSGAGLRARGLYEWSDQRRDLAYHVFANFSRCNADCVADGNPTAAPVRHDAVASQTEQRRASVGFVMQRAPQLRERASRQESAKLDVEAAAQQRLPNRSLQREAFRFGELQHDVTDETVRNEHVGLPGKDVAAFG